jgi:hypothetical protein
MDKKIIKTELPLPASLVNQYAKANRSGENDILFEFDLSQNDMSPKHVLGYLSNLKIDFRMANVTSELLLEYMKTPFFVGRSNLAEMHAAVLTCEQLEEGCTGIEKDIPTSLKRDQIEFIRSLPLYLIHSSNMSEVQKVEVLGTQTPIVQEANPNIGVNLAHLVADDELFVRLISSSLYDFETQRYYSYYFDKYIYGGDRLIQFFIDNPSNMLHAALEGLSG